MRRTRRASDICPTLRIRVRARAAFYPIYSIRLDFDECRWQEGGPFIPGTLFNFGGNSKAEYGSILALFYPSPNGTQYVYEDFRQILPFNPCPTY